MNNQDLQVYILNGLFNSSHKDVPKSVSLLDESMFDIGNRKMFKALVEGKRDLKELGELSGWRYSKVMDFMMGENQNKFLTEGLIQEFKESSLRESAVNALGVNDWKKLGEVINKIEASAPVDSITAYNGFKEQFRELANHGRLGIGTGLDSLDEATKGLIPGHVWVCGAYYGHGKTYFAINLINSCLNQGKRVMFASLEMSSEEIIQRLVSLRSGLNLMEVLSDLDGYKLERRGEAEEFLFNKIRSGDLIIDSDSRDPNTLVAGILRENMIRHVDFVAIDYIQLLAIPGKQYESISEAVQKLQGLAKKIKTTVLMLSQINNASQKEGEDRSVDGFKGAGDIGQVANVAIRIERDRDSETGEFSNRFGLRLVKIRHGKPTKIDTVIEFPSGKIRDIRDGENVLPPKKMTKRDMILAQFEGLQEPIES